MNKFIEKFNFYIICFVILTIPICGLINVFLDNVIKIYPYEILYFIIPFEIIIYIYNLVKKNTIFNKYDLCIIIWFFIDILVTLNAVDVQTSIWGAYNRYEGLITRIGYFLIFLNAKSFNIKISRNIINVLFISGIIEFIYSIFEVFIRPESIGEFVIDGVSYMASGTIGNPNMFGSYCVLLLGLSLTLYLIESQKKYLFLSIVFFINLLLTCSTGPFLSFCLMFVFASIVLYYKKIINLKKIFIIVVILISTFILVTTSSEFYFKNVFNEKIKKGYSIKQDIVDIISIPFKKESSNEKIEESSEDSVTNELSNGRIEIWKNTLKIVPKYFLLGAGIDNFGYVYPQSGIHYCSKAHNEYLQILVTEGIFALLTYICLILNLFIDGIKSNNKIVLSCLMSFIVYIIQAFFNISTLTVAPIYFIIIGMLTGLYKSQST